MILGDFNADGRYLSSTKRTNIRMSSRPYFWLIDEDADTTTSDLNDHTYDRYLFFMLLLSCSESHDFIFSLENI